MLWLTIVEHKLVAPLGVDTLLAEIGEIFTVIVLTPFYAELTSTKTW